jgi:multiple sugar transport system permease protein
MTYSPIDRAAAKTPDGSQAHPRAFGSHHRWIFVAPTIFLLLAVNIFPLIWTIRLSFTNFRQPAE